MAPGRYRDGQGKLHVHLHPQPPEAADGRGGRRYLLRTNLTENDPALLWQYYIQLVAVEEALENLKGDLAIRPVFHQEERKSKPTFSLRFWPIGSAGGWLSAACMPLAFARAGLAPGLTARSELWRNSPPSR